MNFFSELKRRNVYKVAVAYAVVGWLLVQIATQTFPFFEIPNWAVRLVILAVIIGFPIALIIAWAFELTPQGLKRTEATEEPVRKRPGSRAWIYVTLAGLLLSAGLFFLGRYSAPQTKGSEDGRASGASLSEKSVAVLPFENLSEDKANAYFVDGMQDEVITRLAKIGELRVISRTSVQRYKTERSGLAAIARELGVTHLVEGSVQRIGDRVRINVQLIRAVNEGHLWAEIYDRNLIDIFAVQSELATAIARELQTKLTGKEEQAVTEKPTNNMAAYDAYLRGLDFDRRPGQTEENQRKAADEYAEAVRLDPQFAHAWAALGRVHAHLYFLQIDVTPARKEAARAAVENAMRLNPSLAESVLANAYYRYHIERDYEGARVLFEKMRRETPSSSEAPAALARIARRQSRWNDSIRLYEEAAKLNPRDPYLFLDRAWTFSMLRQHVATAQMIEGALALKPDDPEILVNKAKFLQMIGDLPAARAVIARFPARTENRQADDLRAVQLVWERRYDEAVRLIEALAPKRTVDSPADGLFWNNFLASVRSLAGDREGSRQAYLAARATLETLQRDQPKNAFIISAFAFNEAGLGNKEAALREAERAVALFPAAEDPVFGPAVEENLAAVEGLVGETDRAVARLERLLSTPYGAFPVTQASMRIDPVWDPLRSHPRFKALADGPEPKTVYK